jgi:hypothetical protein
MARVNAITSFISVALKVLPYGGIIAVSLARCRQVMMFCINSSLSPFSFSPSFSSGGTGVRLLR